jgi:hypothetical protein
MLRLKMHLRHVISSIMKSVIIIMLECCRSVPLRYAVMTVIGHLVNTVTTLVVQPNYPRNLHYHLYLKLHFHRHLLRLVGQPSAVHQTMKLHECQR